MLLRLAQLFSLILVSTNSLLLSSSSEYSSEEDKFMLKNAADAFDLVFSAVNPDEQCKLAFQNCVLNENNNNQLDMTMKCDVIAKSIMCLEKASFRNSECEYGRSEAKINRYQSFLKELSSRCDNDDDESGEGDDTAESPRLKFSSSASSPSLFNFYSPTTHLFLIFLFAFFFV